MQTKAYAVLYYHFVWKTWEGEPLIREALQRPLYRCIESEVERLGGTANHIHLVVQLPTQISPSRLMQQVKGVSAQFGRDFLGDDKLFRWQHGYGVFTLSRPHLKKAITYTNNQREHHDCQQLWSEWEQSEVAS